MNSAIDITSRQRKTLVDLLRQFIPGIAVWAYGSRVRWTARPNSDLDLVAFIALSNRNRIEELKEALAESDLPFLVDMHIWEEIPESFRKIIREDYVVIQDQEDESNGLSIANGWQRCEVASLISGNKLVVGDGYRAKNSELGKKGLPFARAGNIDGGFRFSDADRFPLENLHQLGNKVSLPGDVVFTSKGTVGRFAFVLPDTEKFVYSPQLCFWRSLDRDLIVPRFLYYWMLGPEFYVQFRGVASQTDMAEYVSLSDQRRMYITLPKTEEQRAIAHILGALDDKIEQNRIINETLEAMVEAIFKSWFVDFDPVRAKADGQEPDGMDSDSAALFPSEFEESELGMIPKGWKFVKFGTLLINTIGGDWGTEEPNARNTERVAIIRGTDFPTVRSGFTSGIPIRFTSARKLESRALMDGDMVIEVSGGSPTQSTGRSIFITSNLLGRFSSPVVPASFCRLFRPLDKPTGTLLSRHLSHIYGEGKMWAYQNQSTGISNFQTTRFLESELVCLPTSEVLLAFHEMIRPMIDRQQLELAQILANLRDTLLPRLVSGKLRVPEAEKFLEAVP
jgi:type I restriction enzyme S subunit